ncbi:MAG: RusA family crossover junction endodeoxyribonuclease [Okeania sp. SIO3B5]|uniref:RusA family crossover junction endodeoxyribonuclease n=1 Tax=Okeania sp. SIO3B5 TaxID=2607811 RepID=UPI00140136DD|nr:RusA family crossover junction endodeoxyribonuclease [Okeania sp. SIO3B5]NEO53338.1 RusA family crossover junction endodeoxyribonuclease [Okeania sp. SIO3B5]
MLINWQDLIIEINFKHKQCQDDPMNAMAFAYSLGQLLLEIKALFSPTEWQSWLKKNCNFSESCAETYLQIAKSWPSFRTQLDAYRKIDLSTMENMPQMPLISSESKDNVEEDVNTEANQIIPLLNNTENFPTSIPGSEESENATIINFYLPGKVVPKARPRVTTNGTYLPPRYRAWRNQAEVEIYRQVSELNLEVDLPIKRAAISISFCGKHRTNSDLDNLAGACLDALTLNGAGVLQDDRLSCIPKLTIEHIPNVKETGVQIKIEILPVR